MDDECRARWEQLVKIHFATKRIILRAEELQFFEHRTYIQPIREERDAFEHVCRGIASYLGLSKHADDEAYLLGSFEAARKHVVRAFFDAADWYGIVLREGVKQRLQPYSNESIRTALPDYYSQQKGHIDNIVDRIVECREQKDASDEPGTYQEVVSYGALIGELEDIYQQACRAAPQLEELHQKERERERAREKEAEQRRRAERPWSLLISIVAGLIVAIVAASVSYLYGVSRGQARQQPNSPQATEVLNRQ